MRYKIVVFDLDGVIFDKPWRPTSREVAVSTWDVIFKTLDIYDIHEKLKEIFVTGGYKSYMEWSDVACCVLKARKLDKKTFEKIINSRPFVKGAREAFKVLKQNGIVTGVVSGSFEELGIRAKKELGINHVLAHCRLIFDDSGSMKDWKLFATDWKDKISFVRYLANLHKVRVEECAYVGDDVNDIPVFKKVGLSIAFNATKSEVKKAAKVVIDKKDMREILPVLGLRKPGK